MPSFITVVISDRWPIFEIAKDLKARSFSSILQSIMRLSLKMPLIFTMWLGEFVSFSSFLL